MDVQLEEETAAVTSTAAAPAPTPDGHQPTTRAARWVRFAAAVVLVALALASLGYLGVRWAQDGSPFSTGTSSDLPAQRDAAMSQTRQFALRINTYGPSMLQGKTMPGYRTQVEAVLTDAFKADFEKGGASLADATVAQEKVKASAQVYSTGVAAIDADTATVLVAGDLTFAYPKKPGSSTYVSATPEAFRWEVQLDRVNGTWLVDGFNPTEGGSVSTTTSGDGAQ